jgi:hypothetical protein
MIFPDAALSMKSGLVKTFQHMVVRCLRADQGAENRSPVTVNGTEPEAISPRPVGRRA